MNNKSTYWLLYAIFPVLLVAYYVQYSVLVYDDHATPVWIEYIENLQWYVLFVSRELKTFILALALYYIVRKDHLYLKGIAKGLILFQGFELFSEIFQMSQKGSSYEVLWIMILGFLALSPLLPFIKRQYEKLFKRNN